ncbi:similar to Transmembrane protein 15 [Ectocarpus siliculosus]|uniref:dolichol kinase n=1 Tax=Ectocarpus siliculosus TaxID=2880 RepID=D8LE86_ECTSI|nr:similar to Transmembrane protein 15 [Ectocarpus siliculosus]|eukprot:CBN74162.1 similar to Transmembrane protein 15 [Ectocarpus siliculosus]
MRDFERRDSEELLELSLRAAAEKQGTAPSSSSAKNGDLHRSSHAEAKRGTTSSNNNSSKGGGSATTTTTTSSALQRRSPSAAAPQPTTPTPARRQRHHHHYRKGGEVLFIAEGVAQAAVGIIRDPVRGAQADGARGLVRGIGSGVFGVVLKPVKGVAKAGVNAYTGVRIGVSKAGRVVVGSSRGGSTSAPSSASKGEEEAASSRGNGRQSSSSEAAAPREGGRGGGGGLERLVAVEWEDRPSEAASRRDTAWVGDGEGEMADASASMDVLLEGEAKLDGASAGSIGGSGGGGGRGSDAMSRSPAGEGARPVPPPPLDGLAVGVVIMPLVVASVFLLAEMNRIRGAGSAGGVGEGDFSSKPSSSCDVAGGCGGAAAVCADGAELSGYLEVILESSTLCAVWEVLFAIQRVIRGTDRRRASLTVFSRLLSSQPLRLAAIAAGCLMCCGRPLLPLWCVAVYDVFRRALDLHKGRQMRRLSLRAGEAAVLTHALSLWVVDACLYTVQELWAVGSSASTWERMFPRVPSRSESMVVVQTGILGTLVTGLALASARALTPAGWRSSRPPWQSCALTYTVLAGGTAAWLTYWTAPLLGYSNPVAWVALHSVGYSDPAETATRAGLCIQSWTDKHVTEGWRGGAVAAGVFRWAWSEMRGEGGIGEGMGGNRPLLVAGWVLALAVVVPSVPWLSRRLPLSGRKTTSRKLFHFLATAMFVPAIALEPDFLSLALGTALGVLLALEFLRCTGCPPLASAMDGYYGGFLDARDGGCVVVTHLFLLVGCAVPVWLSGLMGSHDGDGQGGILQLFPYAGVVVLGIGDAMGAMVGSSVGRLHWPGSRRTLEGSASVFLSTLGSLLLLWFVLLGLRGEEDSGGEGWRKAARSLAWPVAVTSLMEAFTTQVDNLVLPCVLLACLAVGEA